MITYYKNLLGDLDEGVKTRLKANSKFKEKLHILMLIPLK